MFWSLILGEQPVKFSLYLNKYEENLVRDLKPYMNGDDSSIIRFNGSPIKIAHLAATSLGYYSTKLGVPRYWTGWGGFCNS
ncbi:MAG: hypothetical protein ACRC41_13105 [Sarcina sp.]